MSRLPVLLVLVLLAFPASADAAFRVTASDPEGVEGESINVTVVRDTALDKSTHVFLRIGSPAETPLQFLRGEPEFVPGQDTATVKVVIPGDATVQEGPRELPIFLGTQASGTVLVHDDDLEFTTTAMTVDEAAGVAHVPIRRLDATATASQTLRAIPGAFASDIGTMPRLAELPAGQLTGVVDVPIIQDALREPDESFQIAMGPISSIRTIAVPEPITVTIRDDRAAPAGRLAGRRTARLGPALSFTASSAENAAVALDLRLDPALAKRLKTGRVLARKSAQVVAGAPLPIRLRLAPATVRKLRHGRRVTAVATATFTDAAGNHRTVTRRITLTR